MGFEEFTAMLDLGESAVGATRHVKAEACTAGRLYGDDGALGALKLDGVGGMEEVTECCGECVGVFTACGRSVKRPCIAVADIPRCRKARGS
jgi:hypothetical protein